MRGDMGGAATVLGAFVTIVKLQLPINMIMATPLAENMPGEKATKPGDMYVHFTSNLASPSLNLAQHRGHERQNVCFAVPDGLHNLTMMASVEVDNTDAEGRCK